MLPNLEMTLAVSEEEILAKAEAFARLIQSSPEYQTYIDAQEAMEADYNQIVALQQKIQRHPLIRKYLDAQQETIEFVQTVNATIGQVLGLDFGATAGAAKRTC